MDTKEEIPGTGDIKKALLELIESPDFLPEQQLPSEDELMKKTGAGRNTLRQALDELVKTGILEKDGEKENYYKKKKGSTPPKTRIIGVINHYILDSIYPDIIHGIEDIIHENNYGLILANCNRSPEKELNSLHQMKEQNISGLIIEPSFSSTNNRSQLKNLFGKIREMDIPVVTINCHIRNVPVSSVTVDDVRAGYLAADYFLTRGHTKIAIVYNQDIAAGILRCQGFRQALEERSIQIDEHYFFAFSEQDDPKKPGYYSTKELMNMGSRKPTAIFYYADSIALQAYPAFRELGISIPGDLSIMGFDNLGQTGRTNPPLTTFEHPKYFMGKWAAQILFEELNEDGPLLKRCVNIKPQLIERSSVKDLR